MFTYLSFTAHFLIRLDFPMIRFRTKAASLDFPLTLSSVSFASHRFHLQSASLRFPKYHFANCNGDDYLSFLFIIFCQNVAGTIHSKSVVLARRDSICNLPRSDSQNIILRIVTGMTIYHFCLSFFVKM